MAGFKKVLPVLLSAGFLLAEASSARWACALGESILVSEAASAAGVRIAPVSAAIADASFVPGNVPDSALPADFGRPSARFPVLPELKAIPAFLSPRVSENVGGKSFERDSHPAAAVFPNASGTQDLPKSKIAFPAASIGSSPDEEIPASGGERLHLRETLLRLAADPAQSDGIFEGRTDVGCLREESQKKEHPSRVDIEGLRHASLPWRTSAQLARLLAEPRGSQEPFEFAVIGDMEPGRFWLWRFLFNKNGMSARILEGLSGKNTDFIMQLGDMVSRGTPRRFLRFFKTILYRTVSRPWLTTIGNHDRDTPHAESDAPVYHAIFGETNYYFDRGKARFIVLDTSGFRLSGRQLEWLDATLDTEKTKIIFTHMSPNIVGSWNGFGPFKHLIGFDEGASEFAEIVSRRKVDRVYVGHVHGFDSTKYRGVRYVLTAGGGSPMFPVGVKRLLYHYLTVRVSAEGIQETLHFVEEPPFIFQKTLGAAARRLAEFFYFLFIGPT